MRKDFIKQQIFAAAVDGIRKTAFNDGLHVEVHQSSNRQEATVKAKVGKQTCFIKLKVWAMIEDVT